MCRYGENKKVRLDYRQIHMNTLDDEVETFPHKAERILMTSSHKDRTYCLPRKVTIIKPKCISINNKVVFNYKVKNHLCYLSLYCENDSGNNYILYAFGTSYAIWLVIYHYKCIKLYYVTKVACESCINRTCL